MILKNLKVLGLIFPLSCLYSNSNQFIYKGISPGRETVSLQTSPDVKESVDGFSRLTIEGQGHTTILGMPELPSYATLFQIDPQTNYRFEVEIIESFKIENIKIVPYQGVDKSWEVSKIEIQNLEFYNSSEPFPEQNLLVSERIPGRGIEMVNLQVIPYKYHPHSQQLEVYSEVAIHIIKVGENTQNSLTHSQPSQVFDQLYKSMVINFESSERNEVFQEPAILYITGGSSSSNNDFQNLIDWRKERGYTVYTASLTETGSSTTSIKNYIQNAYNTFDPPPEYVALVGDIDGSYTVPTYYNGWGHNSYGNECEGDHPYSQLDGGDLIPEILVGRMSVRNSSELSTVSNKIIKYEKATYLESLEDYYEKAALAGDPSTSGNSCAVTKEQVAEIMDAHGVEDIRLKTSGGSWASWMEDQLEEGVLFFNYRGYIGMSGFNTGDVDDANNGYKLPFATVLTCGTGSFSEESTTMTEKLFRAGSSSNPKGAVAAIGTATWNTHTLFNNIVDMGIYEGLFADEVQTAGAALASGKLALYNTYPGDPDNWVSAFTQWNNLMGDPATHLYTDTPVVLNVTHVSEQSAGANFIDVLVQDEYGNNIENARVTLWYRFMGSPINEFSDNNGMVTIDLAGLSTASYTITITKNNHQPYSGSVAVNSSGALITVDESSLAVDDFFGNDDGNLNPGETVVLSIPLLNNGTEDLGEVSAVLTAESGLVTITDDTFNYGAVNVGETSNGEFGIFLSSSAIQNEDLGLRLNITDDVGNLWESEIRIDVQGSHLVINGNYYVEHGETPTLQINLSNIGQLASGFLSGEVTIENNLITIEDPIIYWNEIPSGETGLSIDSIHLVASDDIINGSTVSLYLYIQSDNGYDRTEIINLQVGTVSVTDPLGPDEYGYYIYDSNDTGYELAPVYDWIEIDPSYGGTGTDLNLSNNGDGNWSGNGSIAHVNLPFNFRFYGIDYTEITVSTNGWVALGNSDVQSFRNYPIPGAGGPSPMIAAFWDDLETTSSGDVFTYFDNNNDYVIIEWSDMRTNNYNSEETFQMILYNDSNLPNGDGNIKIQYKIFNNTSSGIWVTYPPIHGGYSTIGIENHLANQGLQFSYYNQYPTAAMQLENETALYITMGPAVSMPSPSLSFTPSNVDFNLNENQSETSILAISNTGEEGSELTYSVSKSGISPFEVHGGGPDNFGYLWSDSEIEESIAYNWVDIEGMGNQLSFPHNDTADEPVEIGFDFPYYGMDYEHCTVNPNGWIGFGADNTAYSNTSLPSTSAPKPAIFGFWDDLNPVSGDQGGCLEGSGNVYGYSDGSQFVVWFNDVARCANNEQYQGSYDFQFVLHSNGDIDLNYRDMSGYTSSATIGMQNEDGSTGLLVGQNNGAQSENSLQFRQMDNADWLTLNGELSGSLSAGEESIIEINADASGLSDGDYFGNIFLASNGQSSVTIPVALTVGGEDELLGDLNGDGEINVLDVVVLVNVILDGGDYISAGDMNQDGALDVLDIVTLVNIILN